MWGLPSPLHCPCPLHESSVVMDRIGYQQDGGTPHPRHPRLWSSQSWLFCKDPLSAEGSGFQSPLSWPQRARAPHCGDTCAHWSTKDFPANGPTCCGTSLGYVLVSRHLWGCGGSSRLVPMSGEMEQVEQKSVSMGKLQVDRLVACSLLK